MKAYKVITLAICVFLILWHVHWHFKYAHDYAVMKSERGNNALGIKNVSKTNNSIEKSVGQIRNDVVFIIREQDQKLNILALNNKMLASDFTFLRKILDDIIGYKLPPKVRKVSKKK